MHNITPRNITNQIALELKVAERQVAAALALLDSGATVPFIARYRKEATGGLDDVQLRELQARLAYLRELQERLAVVVHSIEEQGKMTPALLAALHAAPTKQELEDLYLPYRQKRRTRGQIAREAGLEPLAEQLFANPALDPAVQAQPFVKLEKNEAGDDFTTLAAVLDGVRDILSERWAEDAALVQELRAWAWQDGLLVSNLIAGRDEQQAEVAKFRDYFDYAEPIARVPSHRALAVFRGRSQDILEARLVLPDALGPGAKSFGSNMPPALSEQALTAIKNRSTATVSLAEGRIALKLGWQHLGRSGDDLVRRCVAWTWRVKLSLAIERDLFARLRLAAEQVAIQVFADNVRDLLLAPPAGARVVLGLDPGIRTGVKVAVVDATGKLVDTATVFPHEPRRDWDGALHTLGDMCARHGVSLIAIGNGTASRETDRLAADLIEILSKQAVAQSGKAPLAIEKIVVSEAGASVYSASEYASQEMPDVDVSLRGAASIARRLQDPLAELVKIDPKSIGVGQYQHDVHQGELARTLDAVVEDCVNAVGVDLNTASVPLLARVSGLSPSVARAVVRWRDAHGAFADRTQLLQVSGLGVKTFEQSAGFLRIRGGTNPLDMTGVHPETYPVVQKMLASIGRPVAECMGRSELLRTLRPESYADAQFGVVTVQDILSELEKPGRDPRGSLRVARFNEGVRDLHDLKEGMVLEGTVSNVAAFGAFVDLGVHQDGLVHVSQLSHSFVTDARTVVKTGDVVRVQVLQLDLARKRISLSMKLGAGASAGARAAPRAPAGRSQVPRNAPQSTTMSCAFAKLKGLSESD